MEINEIRRRNLELLVQEMPCKTLREVAERAETSANYLSQLRNRSGGRNIGDELARSLERGCGKGPGWMDVEHTPGKQPGTEHMDVSQDEVLLLRAYRRCSENNKAVALLFCQKLQQGE